MHEDRITDKELVRWTLTYRSLDHRRTLETWRRTAAYRRRRIHPLSCRL